MRTRYLSQHLPHLNTRYVLAFLSMSINDNYGVKITILSDYMYKIKIRTMNVNESFEDSITLSGIYIVYGVYNYMWYFISIGVFSLVAPS